MRRCGALAPGVLLALLVGCATSTSLRPAGAPERARAAAATLPPGGVILDFVLIERPLGDRDINHAVWGCTNQQILLPERRDSVESNGFRVGRVIGMPPQHLQDLITSDRGCVSRWRQIVAAGKPVTLTLGRPAPAFHFFLQQDGEPVEVTLHQAQPFLVTVPTLAADGRTRLRFTPQVQHGETQPDFQPAPDRSGWLLSYRKPSKTYPALSWEVSLAPNEYLVIGAVYENPQSLGYRSFVQEDGPAALQRLLILRTTRSQAEADPESPDPSPDLAGHATSSPPLALQASWITARASRP